MARRTFRDHLDPNAIPKRILALDGGGLRGVLTVAFLKRIEDILRAQAGGDPSYRLSDYFDLIGGTSTGSIIAAGLSLGMSVDEIRAHYFRLGRILFKPGLFRYGILSQRYDSEKVSSALRGVFGDRTLGSSDFKTGLFIMIKRLDTGSAWPITNNPNSRYFNAGVDGATVANKDYLLWSMVRASTAAPTYFEPESIVIKTGGTNLEPPALQGEFIDGGVSTANNPSLQLVLTATVKGYGFGWKMGVNDLSVTSVGTGRANEAHGLTEGIASVAALHAVKALRSVLDDCADLVEIVMQWMSHSPTARTIDRDIGTLSGSYAGTGPSLTYLRYNIHFETDWVRENLGIRISKNILDDLAKMDRPVNMTQLERLGQQAAERFVHPEHFFGS